MGEDMYNEIARLRVELTAATKRAEEAERERDEKIVYIQRLVASVAENRLDGYRELGARAAAAEARADAAEARLAEVEKEAEENRRTAEAAVKFLGRIGEVTWEAGMPSGDREQTLRNVRALAARLAEAVAVLREVGASGVEFEDERISYTSVQIDRETWANLRAFLATLAPETKEENRG